MSNVRADRPGIGRARVEYSYLHGYGDALPRDSKLTASWMVSVFFIIQTRNTPTHVNSVWVLVCQI